MKTIIKIFICLSLIYTPFFAFAGAAEKWEVLENNYDHLSNKVKIEARKITQEAANSGRYKVELPVSPAALGKTVKTMMWTGLAVAGVEAMLEGIGWVIEHGSQTIYRYPTTDPSQPHLDIVYSFFFASDTIKGGKFEYRYYSSPDQACNKNDLKLLYPHWSNFIDRGFKWENGKCKIPALDFTTTPSSYKNPNYNPNVPEPQREYISDSQLGSEIIGKGENTEPLPAAVEQAYSPNNPLTEPAPEASRDALDNANPQPETEPKGESETEPEIDPETGEQTGKEKTTFELPNFCSWAPAVCDFFTVQKADNKDIKKNQREQIEQDKTFFEKVTDWFDWSQADDDLPDNESPEIVEHVTPDLKEDAISWVASCPADELVPISLQGVSSTLVLSWTPWCQLLSVIKPAIIASAYIGAAFIVLGIRT